MIVARKGGWGKEVALGGKKEGHRGEERGRKGRIKGEERGRGGEKGEKI